MEPSQCLDHVVSEGKRQCSGLGLECHPFKVGWYNEVVESCFKLPHPPDTLGLLIISPPSMFELLFKPFISSQNYHPGTLDPLDQCLKEAFQDLTKLFPDQNIESIQDFELHPNKRPKILVQTVGHVAGAARYYQRKDVTEGGPWGSDKQIYGVSVHPKYGGWFALRGVLIFHDLVVPDLQQKEPIDCVPTNQMRVELLHKYNMCWRDWTFRDVCECDIIEKYSSEQKRYFETPPKERQKLVSYLLKFE